MGREIRRVPPNWKHPVRDCPHSPWAGGCSEAKANGGKCFQPLYDHDAEWAWAEWQKEYAKWIAGEHDRVIAEHGEADYPKAEPYRAYCKWNGVPPDPEYYRPKWDEADATWFQVYQTVSEGSPVTPPFATKDELIEYLVAYGDFWDQSRRRDGSERGPAGWSREAAMAFVKSEFAPSLMTTITAEGVVISEPRDASMYS